MDVAGIGYELPDGRVLLDDVTFRVGDCAKVALVGANGSGKTTLTRIIAGDLKPHSGSISRSGGLGVMRQFVGSVRDESTVRDLLLGVAPEAIQQAAPKLDKAELAMMEHPVPVLLTSGYDESMAGERMGSRYTTGFLQKPYTPEVLAKAVREVLDKSTV